MYPKNDNEFTDQTIESADSSVITCDGWSLFYGKNPPFVPKAGQVARMYGRGLGYPVRGLFIDGVEFWYRTEEEEKEHHSIQTYGKDAADWLARWDSGQTVHTIEMGGLGPGYEQCIHIACAEMLRWMLANLSPEFWAMNDATDGSLWREQKDRFEKEVGEEKTVQDLGLSGAQWGAALNLAAMLHKRGPREVMADSRVKDRHIMVCKNFPH